MPLGRQVSSPFSLFSRPPSTRPPPQDPELTSSHSSPPTAVPTPTPFPPQPPPPRTPFPWLWRCHYCHSIYRLGCTRRCLECSHYFCTSVDAAAASARYASRRFAPTGKPRRQARRRPGVCRAEFDYSGWAAYGSWRRSVLASRDVRTRTTLLPRNTKANTKANTNTNTSTNTSISARASPNARTGASIHPRISTPAAALASVRARKITAITGDSKLALFVAKRHDCWIHCDFPSECHHAAHRELMRARTESEMDNIFRKAQRLYARDAAASVASVPPEARHIADASNQGQERKQPEEYWPGPGPASSASSASSTSLGEPDSRMPSPPPVAHMGTSPGSATRLKSPDQILYSRRKLAQLTGDTTFIDIDTAGSTIGRVTPPPAAARHLHIEPLSRNFVAAATEPLPVPVGPDNHLPSPSRETFYLDETDLSPGYARPPEYEYGGDEEEDTTMDLDELLDEVEVASSSSSGEDCPTGAGIERREKDDYGMKHALFTERDDWDLDADGSDGK